MGDFLVDLIAATLRIATPLIFATLGELFCERAGILNLGVEGTMFFGAFSGFTAASLTGSLWMGILCAFIGGMISGLIMSLFSVRLGVNQHVSGLGVTLLMTALSLFGFRVIFGENRILPSIQPFQQLSIFSGSRVLGPIFSQYTLTYIALALIPIVWWVVFRTNFGLNLRSVGDNPEATDAAGINVYRLRTIALVIGGALMSVGGAYLSVAQLGSFTFGIVAGRGWVCIALIIFANWHPVRVLWGALLFGGVQALQSRLQLTGLKLPYELFLALPYIVTIIALTIAGRNASYPAALLKPYKRE
ncbi:MAG TPA: ABC transporter permease [Anaerolineaceae bacterium]|nr:ABC transporter permease [Anaerolineaceae bacterium]HNS06878.1 ABC transporter permease [Anaerolineaceae bacterium]HNW13074.1 ABC transporter permease [Anaerolineaceae bacterium]HOE02108.1 ABC transporter permease [Anaerolineaceae bacterium]HOQ70063.1 ABC transporter permease [Anaerolineaceae bacterium]